MEIKGVRKKADPKKVTYRQFKCISCGNQFEVPETDIGKQVTSVNDSYKVTCPFCNITMLQYISDIAKIPYIVKENRKNV